MPASVEVAVPGSVPDPIPGVRFRSRPYLRHENRLTPVKVAVLEVLRDPDAAEMSWPRVARHLRKLADDGTIRAKVVGDEAIEEPRVKARERWSTVIA